MIFLHFSDPGVSFVVDAKREQLPLNVKASASLVLEVESENVLKDRYGLFGGRLSTVADVLNYMDPNYAYARNG